MAPGDTSSPHRGADSCSTRSSSSSARWWSSTRSARSRSAAAGLHLAVRPVRDVLRAVGAGERGARAPRSPRRAAPTSGCAWPSGASRGADVAVLLGGHADVAGRIGRGGGHAVVERSSVTVGTVGRVRFGTAFIGVATLGAVIPLRFGKWVPTSGAIGQIVLLTFFTATVVAYGFQHGVHGLASADMAPTRRCSSPSCRSCCTRSSASSCLDGRGGDARSPARHPRRHRARRRRPGADVRVPILAVLVVLPAERISSLHGLIDAMQTVFTVYGGGAADGTVSCGRPVIGTRALLFVWVLLASGSAWIIGAGRAQAAACLDGAGPPVLGRIAAQRGAGGDRARLGRRFARHHGRESRRDGRRRAGVLLRRADRGDRDDRAGLPVRLPGVRRAAHPRPELERPFRVAGGLGGAWLISIVATGWSLLVAVCLLWPGFGTADPNATCLRASPAAAAVRAARHRSRRRGRRRGGGVRRARIAPRAPRAERQASMSGSRPCCIANRLASARLVAPILV